MRSFTAYALQDKAIEKAWDEKGNSIYRAIEPVARGLGDIRDRAPTLLRENLYLIPGDLLLSDFEDRLGDTWNGAKGGAELPLRTQSAIHRVIQQATEKTGATIVLIDLGPNLGALNRAVLSGSDYLIVPVAPDLFSIRGTENLGAKLVRWRQEWDQCNAAWKGKDLPIPSFLGYVMQQHNIRDNAAGMTQGWQIFSQFLEQNETAQRELLTTILKEATWQDGRLRATLLEPFEQLRHSNQLSRTKGKANEGGERD